jgi:hypothetical protein
VSTLVTKLFAIHDALTAAGLAHAFGGAIALAYCTEEPRGTRDLDLNIFADSSRAQAALGALPAGVSVSKADVATVVREGQTRLWWDDTPIDVFLNNHPYHDAVAGGVMWVPLERREVPVLDCSSLVVFKALFNRTRDWADIEAVSERSPRAIAIAATVIEELLGADDPVYRHLLSLARSTGEAAGAFEDSDSGRHAPKRQF